MGRLGSAYIASVRRFTAANIFALRCCGMEYTTQDQVAPEPQVKQATDVNPLPTTPLHQDDTFPKYFSNALDLKN
ncbi:hypothetical protein TNCT_705411 [Trichonephila clavata]|uniref:Uncharacterized protein n=1 Tax=Trichonephila clavata TaxID=2740835 RepID=A0A8X6KPM6_TRICU|nr:hypothetical protein TNCT_705411 [Trichonephila clavata]